ncbi:unnamed protein product [Orchesella dallaii]|uniref:ARID domain-containing protein n=1 Tax=Orchesella dallaii TaxID=48710 RepID=A0ABP1R5X5_9HEXA
MGIQQKDPEYLGAKYAFIRDLIQFHESRGTGLQCDPKINGKEVDLYLLYQIVTSHGGWEKINLRNEWDKLLEHFHMPRSTNGGVAIKQIYLKYLELYEKIHYLGEEVDAKADDEDDYEDFRGRRRYPGKFSSSHSHHHHHHHSSHSHHHHHHHTSSSSHHPPKEITEHNRSQLGLSSRLLETSDYEGLLLSLQSPLPNEQDMAISVCTLLSNETKHVLRFSKSPAILNMLLAHAGIYQDCGMRLLMQESYRESRNMDYAEFWDEVLQHPDARQLLCECFVRRVNTSLGLTDDEGAIISQIQEIEDGDLPEEEKFALGTALRLKLRRIRESRSDVNDETDDQKLEKGAEEEGVKVKEIEGDEEDEKMSITTGEATPIVVEPEGMDAQTPETPANNSPLEATTVVVEESCEATVEIKKEPSPVLCLNELLSGVEIECMEVDESQVEIKYEQVNLCCSHCPCQKTESGDSGFASGDYSVEFNLERPSLKRSRLMMDEAGDGPANSLPFTLARTQNTGDKVGQRISQIAHILRNLSFEQDNACIMAKNATLMRFLLVAANCSFGSLPQTSFDIIGNISSYIKLEEPLRDPLSSMLLTLITSGVFSSDRFKILRSLEALRELTKVDGNENIIARYIENRVYRRMCDLLTLSDIMLLIYTLECILSMTGLGEAVCDEIVRVQGSVATLVSLVTVEAQSYGPKGCILMRVVETVTGASTSTSQQQQSTSAAIGQASTPQQQPVAITQAAVGSPQTQHLLQQQLQQPPIATPVMGAASPGARPTSSMTHPPPSTSPGLKFVTGTTTVVPPVHGQNVIQHKQATGVIYNGNPSLVTSLNMNSSQVFSSPTSTLMNHLSSSSSTPMVPLTPTHYTTHPIHQSQTSIPVTTTLVAAATTVVTPKQSALPVIGSTDHSQIKIVNSNGTVSQTVTATTTTVPVNAVMHGKGLSGSGNSVAPTTTAANVTAVVPGGQPVVAVNGAGTGSASLVTATLPQIANHTLNQHVVTPSISLVTARGTLSEEAWAIAWLKGTFESSSGTSIEQGEIYRMYSAARNNPKVVLSLEQFVQCVKCAYGASVGPVIKQFGGGTSLPFFEGIKPKIAIRAVAVTPASPALQAVATAATVKAPNATIASAVTAASPPPQLSAPASGAVVVAAPCQIPPLAINSDHNNAVTGGSGLIPTTSVPSATVADERPTHILEPDTAVVDSGSVINNNNTLTQSSATSSSADLPVSVHIPSREAKPSLSPILQATLSQPPKTKNSNSNATTVAQRQQNKLQQQIPKNSKSKLNDKVNSNSQEDGNFPSNEVVKVNGIGPDVLDKAEESSASSSVLSSDGSDNSVSTKSAVPITSFHGVLHNGQASMDLKNELALEGSEDEGGKGKGSMKGMLIDLLERRVPAREPVNGMMTGREIRISDKGLELIDKMEEGLVGSTIVNHNNSTGTCTPNEVQESQKMTFYSSTSDAQVTLQGQAPAPPCMLPSAVVPAGSVLSNSVTLASGGGVGAANCPVTLRSGVVNQQVKICGGKFVRVLEQASAAVPLGATISAVTATAVAAASPAIADHVQTSGYSFSGDGYDSANVATTAANGDVTYFVGTSDETPVCQNVTVVVDMGGTYEVDSNVRDSFPGVISLPVRGGPLSVSTDNTVAGTAGGGGELIIDGIIGGGGGGGGGGSDADGSSFNNNNESSNTSFTESNCSNGGDLLEKFSQFSDLIVVPPEQLGLKRPSSPLSLGGANNAGGSSDDLPPPAKRQAVDSTCVESESASPSIPTGVPSTFVITSGVSTSTTQDAILQAVSSVSNLTSAINSTISTVATTTNASLPPGSGAHVVQLPVRLSVNPQNPQQLTFTRQLVLPSGRQLLLSTANSQSPLQGQVIISKPQGSSADQIPKAIIILQPQQQANSQSTGATPGNNSTQMQGEQQQLPTTQVRTISATTLVQSATGQQQQSISSTSGVTTTSVSSSQQIQACVVSSANASTNMVQVNAVQTSTAPGQQLQQQLSNPVTSTHRPSVIPSTLKTVVAVQQHPPVLQQASPHNARLAGPNQQIHKVPTPPIVQGQAPLLHQVVASPLHHAVQSPNQNSQHHLNQPVVSSLVAKVPNSNSVQFEGVKSSSFPNLTSDQLDLEFPFLCEWSGCGLRFLKPQQVSMHALKAHCPETLLDAVRCEWGQNGCDPLLRKRFSLMTHLQDRHCNKQAIEMALYRRKNKIEPPPVPQQPLHHPGYAPNAAFHAIKRHAMSFMNTKELHDDNEGPVTKSIRLTSALILRNLVNYSGLGRRMLQGYESHLSAIAMSNVESSRTIAQLLHDMNDQPKSLK